jgi:hypothetical protein
MKVKASLLFLILIAAHSCVDPIFFDTDSTAQRIVFYGTFSQLKETQSLRISLTSSFGEQGTPITGASVVIKDDLGNCANYEETDAGKYELPVARIEGVPGRSYFLEATFDDGRMFFSDPQELPEVVEAEGIYFKTALRDILSSSDIPIERRFLDIYVDTPLRNSIGNPVLLRWTAEEVYSFTDLKCHPFFDNAVTCYFSIPTESSIIFGGSGEQEVLENFMVHSRFLAPNDEFIGKHYFTVRQYTMTKETFDYWERVEITSNQTGSIFDAQPAIVPGNMHQRGNENESVLGYFEVSGEDILRTYTLPYLLFESDIINTCPERRNYIVEDKCCFCRMLEVKNNRIERPTYWSEDE